MKWLAWRQRRYGAPPQPSSSPDSMNQQQQQAGRTHRLTCTGPGLAHHAAAGWVFGWFCNSTELILWKPRPLVGYPDEFLTPTTSQAHEKCREFYNVARRRKEGYFAIAQWAGSKD